MLCRFCAGEALVDSGCGCAVNVADGDSRRSAKSQRRKFPCLLSQTDVHTCDFDSHKHKSFRNAGQCSIKVAQYFMNRFSSFCTKSFLCLLTLYHLLLSLCPSAPSKHARSAITAATFLNRPSHNLMQSKGDQLQDPSSFPLSQLLTEASLQ